MNIKTCPKCGCFINILDNFCPICGYCFNHSDAHSTPTNSDKRLRIHLFIVDVLIITIMVMALSVAIFLIMS